MPQRAQVLQSLAQYVSWARDPVHGARPKARYFPSSNSLNPIRLIKQESTMAIRKTRQIFAEPMAGTPGLADKLLDLIGNIPLSRESASDEPKARARSVARMAAVKSASTAGALALPPGPLGWLTIAPELYTVWKIQAQMVADIAGVYGKAETLNREQMLYCLFSHTAANAFSDLVIRVGQRYVVRRAPLSALYAIANKVAIRIAQRSAGRVVSRWVPALGALGVAGYVYFDTGRVADASMELFAADLQIEAGSASRSGDEAPSDETSGDETSGAEMPAKKKPRKASPEAAVAEVQAKRKPASKVSAKTKFGPPKLKQTVAKTAKKAGRRKPESEDGG